MTCRVSWLIAGCIALAPSGRAVGAQARVAPPLPYDSTTVRALLDEATESARRAPDADRGPLLSAIGRTRILARDFAGAARLVSPAADEQPDRVLRELGSPEMFAGLERATLARRLSCALREARRPEEALAAVRALPRGAERDWELAHAAVLVASGVKGGVGSAAAARWDAGLALVREVALPDARLDAYLRIAQLLPDTGAGRSVLERIYRDARAVRLLDVDRQRSRNAMLAEVALRLDHLEDARTFAATLTDLADVGYVLGAAATHRQARSVVRELAPRAVARGRSIEDNAARAVYLRGVWQTLQRSGGRLYADSLLPDQTAAAERADDLRRQLDSATAVDSSPGTLARAALRRGDFAETRRQISRLTLSDHRAVRAELLSELAWNTYQSDRDTAGLFLREARAALVAAPRDSAAFDDVARGIADRQFWLGDHAEGLRTLTLVRDSTSVAYVVSQWGTSTFKPPSATDFRGYAEQVKPGFLRDAILLRTVRRHVEARAATGAQVAAARALADSIGTPAVRSQAQRVVANDALTRGDTTEARRRLGELLRAGRSIEREPMGRGLLADLVRAGGWSEADAWSHEPDVPLARARRLMELAEVAQRQLDAKSGADRLRGWSNGPDWCLDEF
ncbi:MAG TPA: hypothetical protein VGG84_14680 [Gemmatimonadaceae bacterium]